MEHVRMAVLESALIFSPASHVACASHFSSRCAVALWKVSAPQGEHVRAAVLESALILSPASHVACTVHVVSRLSPILYVCASHFEHVRLNPRKYADIL